MGHLLPSQPRRRTERRPEEEREVHPREGGAEEHEARRPAAEHASAPLGGCVWERGERPVGESTPINGAEGGRRGDGWPTWWGWPAAAAASSALFAAYHFSVLLLFLPVPYAILGAPCCTLCHAAPLAMPHLLPCRTPCHATPLAIPHTRVRLCLLAPLTILQVTSEAAPLLITTAPNKQPPPYAQASSSSSVTAAFCSTSRAGSGWSPRYSPTGAATLS